MYTHWPLNMPYVGRYVPPLMCVLPGFALLARRWGWPVSLLIAIVYVPAMTLALVLSAVIFGGGI
jgi:hypothetical protein